jgi:hypothetical protein
MKKSIKNFGEQQKHKGYCLELPENFEKLEPVFKNVSKVYADEKT